MDYANVHRNQRAPSDKGAPEHPHSPCEILWKCRSPVPYSSKSRRFRAPRNHQNYQGIQGVDGPRPKPSPAPGASSDQPATKRGLLMLSPQVPAGGRPAEWSAAGRRSPTRPPETACRARLHCLGATVQPANSVTGFVVARDGWQRGTRQCRRDDPRHGRPNCRRSAPHDIDVTARSGPSRRTRPMNSVGTVVDRHPR